MKSIWAGTAIVAIAIFAVATPNYGMQAEEERGGAAPAQVQKAEKEKKRIEAKVRELLNLTGAGNLGKQMMNQMVAQFKTMNALPEGFAEKFLEIAKPDDLVDLIVPIYVELVREEDLDAITAFFKTKSGRRWIASQPKILAESMRVGEEWGRKLAQDTIEALDE